MSNEYRPVRGYEGIYEVNCEGQVVRIGKAKGAFIDRILRPQDNGKGYKFFRLSKNGVAKTVYQTNILKQSFPELYEDSESTNTHEAEGNTVPMQGSVLGQSKGD